MIGFSLSYWQPSVLAAQMISNSRVWVKPGAGVGGVGSGGWRVARGGIETTI